MKRNLLITLALILMGMMTTISAEEQQLAFPGADGYGKYTTGGRGGKVYYVTRNDDCPDNNLVKGTLRWALRDGDNSPRTVLFETSGTIYLTSALTIKSNTSLLGHTAPGGGVCVAGYPLKINGASNVIVRYMRFRAGDIPNQSLTGLDLENAQNVIIDHCSITWSMEECLTAYDTDYTTVQWSIIGEGLYNSKNAKGARAYAMQWGGEHSTMHHTLLTNSHSRSPRFNGVRNKSTNKGDHDYQVDSEFANNVVFNWGLSYGGEFNPEVNNTTWYDANNPGYNRVYMINNFYRAGPCSVKESAYSFTRPDSPYGQWYLNGNKFEKGGTYSSLWDQDMLETKNNDNFSGISLADEYKLATIPALSGLTYESAEAAFDKVTTQAGCALPRYDEVDARLLAEAAGTQNPQFVGETLKEQGQYGIIDSPDDIILQNHDTYTVDGVEYTNYPFLGLQEGDKYIVDSDCDGMPDAYEDAKGFNKNNASDGAATASNGYTNLENYLNGIADGTLNKADYETSEVQVPSGEAGNVPASVTVTFTKGSSGAEGTVPTALTQAYASTFTMPANNTSLYKAGFTLSGWSSGSKTYSLGASFTGIEDLTLAPAFTPNGENLTDSKDDYTIVWDFTNSKAPKLGSGSGIYVTQAELTTATIDVKLDYNASAITVPASKGAKITVYDGTNETVYDVTDDVTTKTITLTNAADVETVTVVLPFKADPTATYHAPVCGEGTSYELLLTPGDDFIRPAWVKVGSYSDAAGYTYDPEKDDKATIVRIKGLRLKAANSGSVDAFVKGTEKVRLFISGGASVTNVMNVKVVPNDGSGSQNIQSVGMEKNVPGLIDIELDKSKSYMIHMAPASAGMEVGLHAIKLFESTALPAMGDATIAWPLSGGSLANASVNPDAFAIGTVTKSDALSSTSGNKFGGTKFYPKTSEISSPSSDQVITFVATPANGVTFNLTKLSLDAGKIGTNNPRFKVTIQYGDGEEETLGSGEDPARDTKKNFTYELTKGASTETITVRIYPYSVGTSKGIEIANVSLTGTYEGTPEINYYTLTTAANPAEGGNVGVNPSSGSIAEGTTVTLTASENSDYLFTGWTTESGATYSTDATISFTMESDMNLTANFKALSEYTDIFKENSPYDAEVKNVEELKVALKAAAKRSNLTKRYRIFLHNATYDLGTTVKTAIPAYTSIIGESMDGTLIVNAPAASTLTSTNRADVTPTLFIDQNQNEVYIQDVTIRNAIDWESKTSTGQALAMRQRGKHTIYKNVALQGIQDTYYLNKGDATAYFETSSIYGTTDYIYGDGTAWFEGCNINHIGNTGYITAPNTQDNYVGMVFNNCTVDAPNAEGDFYLGRPWGDSPAATYLNTTFNNLPNSAGWHAMTTGCKLRFHEYGSKDAENNVINLNPRSISALSGTIDSDNPVLTEAEAATYTIASTFEGWTPQTIAAQLTASAPAISGTTLSWTAVDGAYCYAVCKDGAVIDFTTATSYVVTDETASYSIRVANQMGGLGEASDTATGVNNVNGNSNGNILSVEKVIEAGRLVIKKGDKTYTAAGQQTK